MQQEKQAEKQRETSRAFWTSFFALFRAGPKLTTVVKFPIWLEVSFFIESLRLRSNNQLILLLPNNGYTRLIHTETL